jgi:hypothetical protein
VFTRAVPLPSSSTESTSEPEARDAETGARRGPRRTRRRRGRIVVLVLLLLAVLVVCLGVLAVPLLHARSEAKAAQAHLSEAQAALTDHHIGAASSSVKSAQSEIQAAQDDANGFGSDVWRLMPVFGGAVEDARHLVDALDEATTVGALGTEAYAGAIGSDSKLVTGDTVDMPALQELAATVESIGPHLEAAQADVDSIEGDTPFVGSRITALRDDASSQLTTAQTSYETYQPLLKQLPGVLGANGPRQYLVAMMNPSEQRYSGGATLTMSLLRVSDGRISFGKSYNAAEIDSQEPFLSWPRVSGNVLLNKGPRRLTSATFSPWWQVSGEELSRAWQAQTGQHVNGVFAIDLQALAGLFRLTGPVEVPGYGELNGDNLVSTLAGSYNQFEDAEVRHRLNLAIIPAFREKFLSGGKFVQKGQLLLSEARARHAALYFRDHGAQRAFRSIGFGGDLTPTRYDYIGVFTQNLNGSKTDYWQHRELTSKVHLHADGSAAVTLGVDVANLSPPYTLPVPDPKVGYTTRYLGSFIAVFLPRFATLGDVTADGAPYTPRLHRPRVADVLNRKYFQYETLLPQNASVNLTSAYTLPYAAEVTSDSTMTYQLDVDPQDLVDPESLDVSVSFPKGWSATSLPEGWQATAKGAHWIGLVTTKLHFEIPLEKNAPAS